jgi:spore coat polysaccharide biosynthesis protein SpsF (cytidylyltransferase family)
MSEGDCEHVTRYFYERAGQFAIHNIRSQDATNMHVRLTVDTVDDLQRVRLLAEHFGKSLAKASYQDIVDAYQRLLKGDAT